MKVSHDRIDLLWASWRWRDQPVSTDPNDMNERPFRRPETKPQF
jgi:hypothetical protein